MPRIKKQKKHLNRTRGAAVARGNQLLGYVKTHIARINTLLQEEGHVEILRRLTLYTKAKNLCNWDLGVHIRSGKKNASDDHIKRINASQIHQVSAGERKIKFVGHGSREAEIKEKWLEQFGFDGTVFVDEVPICRPDMPLLCGRMDGLMKINGRIVIIEFKGVLKKTPCVVKKEFKDNPKEIQQCIFYSFLNDWKDVLLVYGLQKPNLKIFTKFLNFSVLKPFKRELEEASNDYFLSYFTENILLWKLLEVRQVLGWFQEEAIKRKCGGLIDVVRGFHEVQRKKKGELKYPALENIQREIKNWKII